MQAWGTPPSYSRSPSRQTPISEPYQSCSCESHRQRHEEINKLIRKCFESFIKIRIKRPFEFERLFQSIFSKQYDFNCIITEETENIERQLLKKRELGKALILTQSSQIIRSSFAPWLKLRAIWCCAFTMVVSILPHAEFGSNDHRENPSLFITLVRRVFDLQLLW